jgi:glucose/mannose-6-phosphate isomerase
MIDKSNMVGVLEDFPNQIYKGYFDIVGTQAVQGTFNKIVFAGMGGSALPGDIARSVLQESLTIPIIVYKSYDLPSYVDAGTLLFIISYSGNTEEALSTYKLAKTKNCKVVVVTSGGKLRSTAEADHTNLILIPSGLQPRLSLGYMFFSVLKLLTNSGIVKDQSAEIKKLTTHLQNHEFKMYGEELSSKLVDHTPIIYASEPFFVVAEIWKIAFNENSKTTAFWNYFPELNHNEMVGYTNPKGSYYAIMIKEDDCHKEIAKRFKPTRDIISKKALTSEIVVKGSSKVARVFTGIYMGLWTSYFLALKYGQDPTPVDLVEEFKKKL